METFSALLALCAGNSPVTGEFPAQRPVTRSFGVFFDLHLNIWLSKQSWGWWFETQSSSLWRHCNEVQSLAVCKCYCRFILNKGLIHSGRNFFYAQSPICQIALKSGAVSLALQNSFIRSYAIQVAISHDVKLWYSTENIRHTLCLQLRN